MTLSQLILILRARWISALVAFLAVCAVVLAAGLLRPRQYTATASVMAEVKSDPIAGMVLQGVASPSYMMTQVDVLQSLRVARRVVRTLGLHEDPATREAWQKATRGKGDIEAWVGERLQAALDVRPSRGSNVISIAYTDRDPAMSAAVANAFVRSYLETTVDLRVEPARQYSSFFDDRAKQAREKLEAAQARLSQYQQHKGIISSDERLDVEHARLAELSSQLVLLQALAADSSGRSAQAGSNAERMQEVLNSPVVGTLSTELSRQEAKFRELTERLGDRHPQVMEARASIEETRARLETATRRASGSVGLNNNVNQARLAQLQASIAEQRAKLLRLKGRQDEAAVLQRDIENAQRAYDGVLARLNQSGLESESVQSNVSALEFAAEPTRPSTPGLRQIALLAAALGGLLAIATAIVRERRDRRVRRAADLPLLAHHPLLGVVPSFAPLKRQPRSRGGERLLLGVPPARLRSN